ncbi:MAG: serine hydrolase [Saprospiraceae bacterium]|nr:serine hydrolase [Saprospiraceae bacterium]
MNLVKILFFLVVWCSLQAQTYYFPPLTGNAWEKYTPEQLGWCTEKIPALYDFLEQQDTKAFIVLKDGKIVLEKYFGTFTADSSWYWASAGKTLTSFLVGKAQEQGKLNLSDPTSKHLGKKWTSLTEDKEDKITIWHQMTMTSGLDDGSGDPYCTDPICLLYKADAGTRWAYHNGPYTLLDEVVKSATGKNLNAYASEVLFSKTGMTGLFFKIDFNNVFFSKPRSMARFGSLILNKGDWNNNIILSDKDYLEDAVNTSQNLNLSYGYLWWLNGKESSMLPGSQVVFNRSLFTNAPADMFSALGKNGQFLNIVPSQNLVMVRMGNFNNSLPVPFLMNDDIWKYFNQVQCTTPTSELDNSDFSVSIFPNPSSYGFTIKSKSLIEEVRLFDVSGSLIETWKGKGEEMYLEKGDLFNKPGIYIFEVKNSSGEISRIRHIILGE